MCPIERVWPRSALIACAELPIGVLAVWEDHLLLRQTLPLGGLPAATLEHTLAALFDTATQLVLVAERMASDPARPIPYGYLFK